MYLNCHTFYSLRFGTIPIKTLVETAAGLGIKRLALTDINNTSAVFDFVKECRKNDIEPVVGVEFRNGDDMMYVCLAKNPDGFSEINSFRNQYHKAQKPFPLTAPDFKNVHVIYPLEALKRMPAHTSSDKKSKTIGIQVHEISQLYKYNHDDFVVLQPVTFLDKQGFNLHRLLRAIDNNCLLSKLPRYSQARNDEMLFAPEQLRETFAAYPHIIENTEKLLNECHFDFDFSTSKNRLNYLDSRESDLLMLKQLTMTGLVKRYGKDNQEALERVSRELKIIDELNYSAYFLITWDIVEYGKGKEFYHVGRGSGANSIVAYCIGITDVDPIELDFYFERFINPGRTSPPDFDIDFSWDNRDEIIQYIFEKFGREHVCLLATHVTFKDRSAYRELGKVFGLPEHEIESLVQNLRAEPGNEYAQLVLKYGKLMDDFPNYLSIHAGGILISEKPLNHFTALVQMPKGFPVCEFDMYVCEDIGFAKFDILSQRGLGHIKESIDIIRENRQIEVDVHAIQDFKNDPNIREQMRRHETMGCFYIESPAMRQLIWKLGCDDYLTLVAASSIIRPGVASSGMMQAFILRHHHPEKVQYIHPKMEELLKETYGVMVYQEDVIKVAHHFSGLTLAESDILRRAMSGKYRSRIEFEKIVDRYFENCKTLGYDDYTAKEVWRQIESFAGYSFSKAHSASYAVESYQSLFLKTYYPLEFMVAVINNFGGFYKTEFYVHEARRQGARIELPDINQSNYLTSIQGITIWLGFIHLKGLEKNVAKQIIEQRKIRKFHSFDDFCRRVPVGLEQLIILVRIGAFRNLGYTKKELMWESHLKVNHRYLIPAGNELFETQEVHYELPELLHDPLEDAYDELELLGFIMQNPFNLIYKKPEISFHANNLQRAVGRHIEIIGYLVTLKSTRTRKGEKMFFGYFTDEYGEFFDTVHFPKSCEMYPFKGWGLYHMKGMVTEEFGHCGIQVTWMEKLAIWADPRID